MFYFIFWLHLQHAEVHREEPQQWPELQQWHCQILNPLCHQGTPCLAILDDTVIWLKTIIIYPIFLLPVFNRCALVRQYWKKINGIKTCSDKCPLSITTWSLHKAHYSICCWPTLHSDGQKCGFDLTRNIPIAVSIFPFQFSSKIDKFQSDRSILPSLTY